MLKYAVRLETYVAHEDKRIVDSGIGVRWILGECFGLPFDLFLGLLDRLDFVISFVLRGSSAFRGVRRRIGLCTRVNGSLPAGYGSRVLLM